MPAHTENKLTIEELDKMSETIVDRFNDWSSDVKVEGMPLNFNRAAITIILKEANRLAFKLMKKAVGTAYINENYNVQEDDSEIAIQSHKLTEIRHTHLKHKIWVYHKQS